MKKNKSPFLSKLLTYLCLITLSITIIVPIAWVFMASIKQNEEFYRNPWALPAGVHIQNFIDAWQKADMGSYMLNSVIVTALMYCPDLSLNPEDSGAHYSWLVCSLT